MLRISGKICVAAVCVLLAAGCSGGKTFKVKGTIDGAKNGVLYLQKEADGRYVNLDSLEMGKNGRFELSAPVEDPQMYYLAFGKAEPAVSFFAQGGEITIDAHIDSLGQARIKGGKDQELYSEFMNYMRDFATKKNNIYLDILRSNAVDGDKDSVAVYTAMYESLERRQLQFVANFAITHPDSYLSPLLAYTFLNKGYSPLLDTIAAKLSPDVMNSRYGKEFSGFVTNAKSTLVGMSAPDFELIKDSAAYSPKTFAGKNLFVVAWTSGNQQNIDFLSALKQVYEKWHDKGLEVLSSNIGGSDEEYGYDIYSLNLPWIEVRDARGVKNVLVDKFALTGDLPAGVLIGRDGTILARYISPEDLSRVLDYLAKNNN